MSLPPLKSEKRGRSQSPAYRAAPAMEDRIAKAVGGQVTPGSGSQRVKGDVRKKGLLRIEAKCTGAKSFSVTFDMLEKIENAVGPGELPVVAIDFIDGGGKVLKSCYVVPGYALDELLKRG